MNNIATLYKFELRKIVKRKVVWITLSAMLALTVLTSLNGIMFTSFSSSDGESLSSYEMAMRDRSYARRLAGRAIDDTLLKQMQSATDTWTYSAIYIYAWHIFDGNSTTLVTTNDQAFDARDLYNARMDNISRRQKQQLLTSAEEAFWQAQESKIEVPFIFDYTQSYKTILSEIYVLNVMVLLLLAICLSGVFSDEHLRQTDQITLCCRQGRTPLYTAKILAGVTFGIVSALLLFSTAALSCFLVYGTDGFHAALQLVSPESSRPLHLGETTLILLGLLLIAALLYSIATMFLSQHLRNSVATMSIMVGTTLLTLFFNMPQNIRLFSQIYSYMPARLVNMDSCLDNRLVTIFGISFTNWQLGPVVYMLLVIILIFAGAGMYRRYQVRGR